MNETVVRIGDTVRRAMGVHSKSIHALLQHLERKGFPYSPRFLGVDQKGREILSYFAGSSAFPQTLWTGTSVMVKAASMLRDYHDATQGFAVDQAAGWAFCYPDAKQHEVICHNDFAPYNMIFRDDLPVGIIDFDLAGPGPRLRDVAYLAYWMIPLSFSSTDMVSFSTAEIAGGCPRVRLLCEAYGTSDYENLLEMVSEVLHYMGNERQAMEVMGVEAADRLRAGGHFQHWQKEAAAYDLNRAKIWRSLGK